MRHATGAVVISLAFACAPAADESAAEETLSDRGAPVPNDISADERPVRATERGYNLSLLEYTLERLSEEDRQAYYSMSERDRRDIFLNLSSASDRSLDDADKEYPINILEVTPAEAERNMDANYELQQQLSARYEQEVLDKYGISKSLGSAVFTEGLAKKWPGSNLR